MVMEFTSILSPDLSREYSFDVDDRILLTEEGYGFPPIEYLTQRSPYQNGETVFDFRYRPRIIEIMFRQDTCSRYDYWDKRAALLDILRPDQSSTLTLAPLILRKKLPNGQVRDLKVVVEQGPSFRARELDTWDEFGFTETIRLIAHDPILYDPTPISITWTVEVYDDLVFPITFPITFGTDLLRGLMDTTYTGNVPSYPIIVVQGPVNGINLKSYTVNKTIRLNYYVQQGETVTIDLTPQRKTVRSSFGTNLTGFVSTDSDLVNFMVAPSPKAANGYNLFEFTGAGATLGVTSVSLIYYRRFSGI